jgi:hypothetical protein
MLTAGRTTMIGPASLRQSRCSRTDSGGATSRLIPDRFDFHTWIWFMGACDQDRNRPPLPECIRVEGIAEPIAKAFNYCGEALLVDGWYTRTVDDPFGLRCLSNSNY